MGSKEVTSKPQFDGGMGSEKLMDGLTNTQVPGPNCRRTLTNRDVDGKWPTDCQLNSKSTGPEEESKWTEVKLPESDEEKRMIIKMRRRSQDATNEPYGLMGRYFDYSPFFLFQ